MGELPLAFQAKLLRRSSSVQKRVLCWKTGQF
ncbi:MAG: hypothetical protein MR004_09675 [Clostridiales bacterium]|nr:hypothetical protein [Clostridiales bacterium]